MTLDEAIKHAEDVAETLEHECTDGQLWEVNESRRSCTSEHRQLAAWLKELKRLREQTEPEKKKGKWIELKVHNCNATLGCPECGRTIHPTFDFGQYSLNRITEVYPYCHCGAKMEVDG